MTKQLLSEIAIEARSFVESRRSLVLSTINDENQPWVSYAPYHRDQAGSFFILVSTLASHTANLGRGRASIMIIDDEKNTKQIYARIRLCFQCDVFPINRQSGAFSTALENLINDHGEIVETLASLADFQVFQLQPRSGRFIKGFGQAYDVDPNLTRAEPVTP